MKILDNYGLATLLESLHTSINQSYLPLSGGTLTGDLTIQKPNSNVSVVLSDNLVTIGNSTQLTNLTVSTPTVNTNVLKPNATVTNTEYSDLSLTVVGDVTVYGKDQDGNSYSYTLGTTIKDLIKRIETLETKQYQIIVLDHIPTNDELSQLPKNALVFVTTK